VPKAQVKPQADSFNPNQIKQLAEARRLRQENGALVIPAKPSNPVAPPQAQPNSVNGLAAAARARYEASPQGQSLIAQQKQQELEDADDDEWDTGGGAGNYNYRQHNHRQQQHRYGGGRDKRPTLLLMRF
jgi:hypothetical protein